VQFAVRAAANPAVLVLSVLQSCYWVNDTARKEMLIRWSEAFSRALLVHCRYKQPY
jgi:hypothetical protein